MSRSDATDMKNPKAAIRRAIRMGRWDSQTGAPVPEVYQLLQQALAATTIDEFLRLCVEADEKLNSVEVELVDGYEMNDAVRFTSLALSFICGFDDLRRFE